MIALIALAAQVAQAGQPPVAVLGRSFLVETVAADGGVVAEPGDRVPLREGVCYRWRVRTTPRPAVVAIDERLTLPVPAATWGGVDGNDMTATRLSADRRVATTSLVLPLTSGMLTNQWCVAPGDPPGRYRIEVMAGARRIADFSFELVADGA